MMMEPVGGMDRIVAGFMRKVGHLVQLESQVQRIRVLRPRRRGHVSAATAHTSPRGPTTASTASRCTCWPASSTTFRRIFRRLHRDPARQAVQDRPADEGALLGARRHLWRHFLDPAGHPADLVSGAWHPSPEGRGARRVHVRPCGRREIRAASAGRSTQARDPAGRKDSSRLWRARGERRQHRLAPDESHARLRGAMGRGAVQEWFKTAAGAGREVTT